MDGQTDNPENIMVGRGIYGKFVQYCARLSCPIGRHIQSTRLCANQEMKLMDSFNTFNISFCLTYSDDV